MKNIINFVGIELWYSKILLGKKKLTNIIMIIYLSELKFIYFDLELCDDKRVKIVIDKIDWEFYTDIYN